MLEIYSAANATFKKLRSVKIKKYRDEYNLYLIEGKKTILEAFCNNMPVKYLVAAAYDKELFDNAEQAESEIIMTDYELLRSLSDTKNPPPYIAYLSIDICKVDMNAGITIAADKVADPYNLGTIIRTADALGAAGVLSDKEGCSIYSPKVQRAAMGSMFHIPVEETDLYERLYDFKKGGGYIITTALDGDERLPEIQKNTCLTVGNEGSGVSDDIKRISDFIYKIPMEGRAESLNVGVACGITLFELKNAYNCQRSSYV